jgi:CDP-diacylglycerol--glycerol-3-phosphate 3-phosphatidyltransferase
MVERNLEKKMNLPNRLTILRTILIIPFVIILLTGCFGSFSNWIALFIFILASITDLLDGKIARKYNLITNFGKFMDPLADKLLVCSALICLLSLERIPAWAVLIIMAREFIISGFRLVAADNGVVIAASMWGKSKTVSQMITIGILIADIDFILFEVLGIIGIYVSVILTIISLIDYIVKNKEVMKEK